MRPTSSSALSDSSLYLKPLPTSLAFSNTIPPSSSKFFPPTPSLVHSSTTSSPSLFSAEAAAAMAKCTGTTTALFALIIALALFVSLGQATRHEPADPTATTTQQGHQHQSAEGEDPSGLDCGGAAEEECLMRRTLVAHTDYIYTQGKKHG